MLLAAACSGAIQHICDVLPSGPAFNRSIQATSSVTLGYAAGETRGDSNS